MKFVKKISSLIRSSSSKSRSPFSVSLSNPSSFSSSSSSVELKETPKSVLLEFRWYPSRESDGWLECEAEEKEEVHCDFAEVFQMIDKDGDGKVTRGELEEVLRWMGSREETALMIGCFVDADGCITMEEFCGLSGPACEPELVGAFDADGDGRISAEELRCMLVTLGDEGCTLDDCRRIIQSMDSD